MLNEIAVRELNAALQAVLTLIAERVKPMTEEQRNAFFRVVAAFADGLSGCTSAEIEEYILAYRKVF